mmetsp:Transcript_16928/g.46790  ORF Transcript_16928/g.46790 Transcript_16928/m.46790 type:complete len:249 (+) Transcript_16928:1690-2436(+)
MPNRLLPSIALRNRSRYRGSKMFSAILSPGMMVVMTKRGSLSVMAAPASVSRMAAASSSFARSAYSSGKLRCRMRCRTSVTGSCPAPTCSTVLHMGHRDLWSNARMRHARQKLCPHGVVTGSNRSFRHSVHSHSSACWESALVTRALLLVNGGDWLSLIAPPQPSAWAPCFCSCCGCHGVVGCADSPCCCSTCCSSKTSSSSSPTASATALRPSLHALLSGVSCKPFWNASRASSYFSERSKAVPMRE